MKNYNEEIDEGYFLQLPFLPERMKIEKVD